MLSVLMYEFFGSSEPAPQRVVIDGSKDYAEHLEKLYKQNADLQKELDQNNVVNNMASTNNMLALGIPVAALAGMGIQKLRQRYNNKVLS